MQFICTSDVADFVRAQLTHVGRASVSLEEISKADLQPVISKTDIKEDTISSLRLDAVCAAVSRQSRQKHSFWSKMVLSKSTGKSLKTLPLQLVKVISSLSGDLAALA